MFSFADNATVSGIEVVPEGFRVFYEEADDGKFKLSDSSMAKAAISSISSLDKSLTDSRKEARDHKAKLGTMDLSPLSEYGESSEEILAGVNARIEELQGKVKGGKDAKVNLDKVREEMNKAHAVDLESKDKRITALSKLLHKELVVNAAMAAIVEAKGNSELLLPFVEKQAQVIEEDGKVSVVVTDSSGDRRFSGTTGATMTIVELVLEMKGQEKYGALFSSDAPKGGGTPPGGPRGGPKPGGEKLSPKDKISAGLAARGVK